MNDLISRSALLAHLDDYAFQELPFTSEFTERKVYNAIRECMKAVKDAPTVEAKPVVYGEWLQEGNAVYHWRQNCSICGNPVYDKIKPYNFCPNCGCDMRGEKHD